MSIKFFWRCEGTTFDGTHDYSAGDSTPTLTGSSSISASAAKVGSNGLLSPASATSYYSFDPATILPNYDDASLLVFSAGFWIQMKATTTQGYQCGFLLQNSAVGANVIGVYSAAAGNEFSLRVANGTTINLVTGATDADLDWTENTWYGLIVRYDGPNLKRKIEAYDASGTLLTEEESTANFSSYMPTGLNAIRLGAHSSSDAGARWHDNFIIGDAYTDVLAEMLAYDSYTDFNPPTGSPLILPHRSGGGLIDLSGNFRG